MYISFKYKLRERRWRHNLIYDVINRCLFSKSVLSREMAAEAFQLYCESNSATKALRTKRIRYPNDLEIINSSTRRLYRLVVRFKETVSVKEKRLGNTWRLRSSKSSENVQEVKRVIEETPEKYVRQVTCVRTDVNSYSSVYRMFRFDLKYFPNTISVMQHLKESDVESRVEFARWMQKHLELLSPMWFSDEYHFYLNNVVNKQNCRFWGTEKPNFHYEKPLHDDKLTVWAALSRTGVIGPFFLRKWWECDSEQWASSSLTQEYLWQHYEEKV